MLKKESREIKIEVREDQQEVGPTRWIPGGFVKIEFDPLLFPPVKWMPLMPCVPTPEVAELSGGSEPAPRGQWLRIMRRTMTRLLSNYLSGAEVSSFLGRFRRWRESTTFVFALLTFLQQRAPALKNHFCDSYELQIRNLDPDEVDAGDLHILRDSVGVVLEFFIGQRANALQEFYCKYRTDSPFDPFKAKKLLRILERAVNDDQTSREIELDMTSADLYEDAEGVKREDNQRASENRYVRAVKEVSGSSDNRPSSQRVINNPSNTFLIYRKDDASKTPLFPMDLNFTIKNAFTDLFPA